VGAAVRLAVAPDGVRVAAGAGPGCPVVVDQVSMSPTGLVMTVAGSAARIHLPTSAAWQLRPADEVRLVFDPAKISLYQDRPSGNPGEKGASHASPSHTAHL
jgi:hypothetical protein